VYSFSFVFVIKLIFRSTWGTPTQLKYYVWKRTEARAGARAGAGAVEKESSGTGATLMKTNSSGAELEPCSWKVELRIRSCVIFTKNRQPWLGLPVITVSVKSASKADCNHASSLGLSRALVINPLSFNLVTPWYRQNACYEW